MLKYLYITAIVTFLMLISICAFAQPTPPGDPPAIPLDGGISLLLAAGGAYGARKLYLYNKFNKTGEEEEDNSK